MGLSNPGRRQMKSVDLAKSVVRVVTSDMVENLTREGWSVVGTIEEEVIATVYEQMPKPPPPANSGVYYDPNSTLSCSRSILQKVTKFVLTFSEESALAIEKELTARISSELETEKKKIQQTDKELKELRVESEKFRVRAENETKARIAAEEKLDTHWKDFSRLQREKALFEKALGVIGVQQILKGEDFTGEISVSPEKPAPPIPDRFNRVD